MKCHWHVANSALLASTSEACTNCLPLSETRRAGTPRREVNRRKAFKKPFVVRLQVASRCMLLVARHVTKRIHTLCGSSPASRVYVGPKKSSPIDSNGFKGVTRSRGNTGIGGRPY